MSNYHKHSSKNAIVKQDSNDSHHHQVGRREFLKVAGPAVSAVALSSWSALNPLQGATGTRPNIVFIFDDQYRQDMSKFIPTPGADRLTREGITFTNGFSTVPLCTPFRGMLMTGRYPTHSGLVMNWVNANPTLNPHCLANVFGKAGYETGFLGKWHLAAGLRVASGLYEANPEVEMAYKKSHPDTEFVPPGPARLGFDFWQAYNFHADFNHYWYYEDVPPKIYSKSYETDTLFDQATKFIEKHKNQEKPFLLVVAPHPPHPPFLPGSLPEGYLEKVPPASELYHPPNVPKTDSPRSPQELRCYLAMAMNIEDNLVRLMDYLDRSGASRDTILVFSSDHGEMHGSHGRVNKMVPYTEAVNIPLIMRWPGRIPAGTVSDTIYTPIDHLPTLCGLAGLQAPGEVDGEDLSGDVLGRSRSFRSRVLMANYTSHWDFFQTNTVWPEWRGVRTKRYTYVKWLTGAEELYDNLDDPYQMRNLVGNDSVSSTLRELRGDLKELMIAAHDNFLNGRQYADWYDKDRNLLRSALGPVHR
ncbi:MAG: sulfatase [Acidobacteria bacterium]|nr:sulfatase [Acidobacteriota bacterium]